MAEEHMSLFGDKCDLCGVKFEELPPDASSTWFHLDGFDPLARYAVDLHFCSICLEFKAEAVKRMEKERRSQAWDKARAKQLRRNAVQALNGIMGRLGKMGREISGRSKTGEGER